MGLALSLLVGVPGCAPAAAPDAAMASCEAVAVLPDSTLERLTVSLRCTPGAFQALVATEEATREHLGKVTDGAGVALPATAEGFALGADGVARWEADLGAMARELARFDLCERQGEALVAPISSWLFEPQPRRLGVPLTLRVETPPELAFVTGLRPEADGHRLETHEIRSATFGVLGRFEHRSLAVGEGRLELSRVGAPLAFDDGALERWTGDAAHAVARFYGRFPVERAALTVLPREGREGVLFGLLLPESAPGIAVLVGDRTPATALRADWVLVHELFHLGTPSMPGEDAWLDEGLATWFEPLIRARAGWLDERAVWTEMTRGLPRGYPTLRGAGLSRAEDFRGIYWGGAVVAFLADLDARRASSGARGLEDGLRAVLAAGGDTTVVWSIDRVVRTVDGTLGRPTLGPWVARFRDRGAPIELESRFAALGVQVTPQGVLLDDAAPLAAVRRSLVFGQPMPPTPGSAHGGAQPTAAVLPRRASPSATAAAR